MGGSVVGGSVVGGSVVGGSVVGGVVVGGVVVGGGVWVVGGGVCETGGAGEVTVGGTEWPEPGWPCWAPPVVGSVGAGGRSIPDLETAVTAFWRSFANSGVSPVADEPSDEAESGGHGTACGAAPGEATPRAAAVCPGLFASSSATTTSAAIPTPMPVTAWNTSRVRRLRPRVSTPARCTAMYNATVTARANSMAGV